MEGEIDRDPLLGVGIVDHLALQRCAISDLGPNETCLANVPMGRYRFIEAVLIIGVDNSREVVGNKG